MDKFEEYFSENGEMGFWEKVDTYGCQISDYDYTKSEIISWKDL